MDADEIPQSTLKNHPELTQILEAIRSYRAGETITIYCKICNQLLKVAEVPVVNSLWVACGNGCTRYREKYKP